MRIDVVSIFPGYVQPLELSLLGRARASGVLDVRAHDLRASAHDRHRTVDDTPYGGGPGMVMRPEPWGEAIDGIVASHEVTPRLIVPTPSGTPFTQRMAHELASEQGLVFACGRYEGIDQRVVDHFSDRMPVSEVSIGDYVLNGGEVAAMVMIEAVARLLPGFLGNAESLTEESHGGADKLLEYPVYTKPASWRELDVPGVLLSGHHGDIARWRADQSRRRTAFRRPDLLHPSQAVAAGTLPSAVTVSVARPADVPELYVLQRCCWVAEAQVNEALFIPPLTETLADVAAGIDEWLTLVVHLSGRLVASVRGRLVGTDWDIGRLMVAPDLTGQGLGRWLLEQIEAAAPDEAMTSSLFTGARSTDNLRMYRAAGYRVEPPPPEPGVVRLVKTRRRR